jgi:hypothetical protein
VLRRRLENPLATALLADQFNGARGVRVELVSTADGELAFQPVFAGDGVR